MKFFQHRFFFERKIISFCLFLFLFSAGRSFASNSLQTGKVEAFFLESDIELHKSDIVSNVLKVVNYSKAVARFTVDVTFPSEWKILGKSDEIYELNVGDSVFIPIRLVPKSLVKGNTQYIINAFVISEEGFQLDNTYFFAHTKKIVDWDLNVGPREKIYFLNNEKTAPFSLNVFNKGNERQDILLSWESVGKNAVVSDTNNKIIDKKFHSLSVKSQMDTTLHFKMNFYNGLRNQKRLDPEGYVPRSNYDERKYYLTIQTEESKQLYKRSFKSSKRLEFIRLGDRKKVNPYGSSVIPLIAETNINNLLGAQPVMNLMLRGNTMLANQANIVYYTQTYYSTYYLKNNISGANFFYLGYFHPTKGDIQVGNIGGSSISSGMPVYGKGISGTFHMSKQQSIGAFFAGDPNPISPLRRESYGVSHRLTFDNGMRVYSQYGRTINKASNITTDFFSLRTTFRIFKKHHIGISGTQTLTNYSDTLKRSGNFLNISYGGHFLNNKLQANINSTFHSKYYNIGNQGMYAITSRTNYLLNTNWSLMLQNNYYETDAAYFNAIRQKIQNINSVSYNQLFFVRNVAEGKIMPSIFYNFTDIFDIRMSAKGVGMDYNYYNAGTNTRFGSSMKAAANQYLNYTSSPQFFTFQFFSILQYKTFSVNLRYAYGPQSSTDTSFLSGKSAYPQNVALSLQHQYQFRNPQFILQTGANYSFYTQLKRQSFGLYPEFYFYTFSGWRFKINFSVSGSYSNSASALYQQNTIPHTEEAQTKPTVTYNYNIGIGVRKEFGIPIPKILSKKKFTDIEFVSFLDVNGNRKKDADETVLENIVIRLGENEVLTNEEGKAFLYHVEAGNYKLNVFSLVELNGWFSTVEDSLLILNQKVQYIPFARGVKLYGNVVLDREKWASEMGKQLDLSRIRITATDSSGKVLSTLTGTNGEFMLYVPYGAYILTMDETILDGTFTLAKNNIPVTAKEGMESFYNSFYVVERKRKGSVKKFDTEGHELKDK